MDTKNTTMVIISLAIGVVLIAGVVTPILASLEGSDSGGSTYTNVGERMDTVSNVVDKYHIQSVYEEGKGGPQAGDGSTSLQFQEYNGTLKMKTITWGEDDDIVTEIATITENCILVATSECIIAYDSENSKIVYACKDMPVPVRSDSLDTLMDFYIYYDYTFDDQDNPQGPYLQYSLVIGQYAGGGVLTPANGYLYDPAGNYVSLYNTGSLYYNDWVISGYINTANPIGADRIILGYLDNRGTNILISSSSEYITLDEVNDNHEDSHGCKLIDIDHGYTIDYTFTDNDMYITNPDCYGNLYIAPLKVNGYEDTGATNNGNNMSAISDLLAKGYTYKIELQDQPTTHNHFQWAIYDENGNLLRSSVIAPYPADYLEILVLTSELVIGYIDHDTQPSYTNFLIGTEDDGVVMIDDPTALELTISPNTFHLEYTGPNGDVSKDFSNTDGFAVDYEEGTWTYISVSEGQTATVRYKDLDGIYPFENWWNLVYFYNGASSNSMTVFAPENMENLTVDGFEGVRDMGSYKEFDAVFYREGYTDNNPSGLILSADLYDEPSTYSCTAYIVPKTIPPSGGSGSGGVDGTLAAMISVIPLVMAVGLVIGAIKYIKMKN